jgi:hypothetical protein
MQGFSITGELDLIVQFLPAHSEWRGLRKAERLKAKG